MNAKNCIVWITWITCAHAHRLLKYAKLRYSTSITESMMSSTARHGIAKPPRDSMWWKSAIRRQIELNNSWQIESTKFFDRCDWWMSRSPIYVFSDRNTLEVAVHLTRFCSGQKHTSVERMNRWKFFGRRKLNFAAVAQFARWLFTWPKRLALIVLIPFGSQWFGGENETFTVPINDMFHSFRSDNDKWDCEFI